MQVMTPMHPRWDEFFVRLRGPEGCDFQRRDGSRDFSWKCDCDDRKPKSRAILKNMGFTRKEINASCRSFEEHGGFCDCEVLINCSAW